MNFIQLQVTNESQQNEPLNFSDDEKSNDEDDFIDNSKQPMEDIIFYKKLDPENIEHYNKFPNQSRDPWVAVYEDEEMFFGTEDIPELYTPENRKSIEFDKFQGFEKSVNNLKIHFEILKTATTILLIQYCMV